MSAKRIRLGFLTLFMVSLVAAGAAADDLSGAKSLLCSSSQGTVCSEDEGCETAPPWAWNIPSFIEVDLAGKSLNTTAASGENRSTPIRSVERADGKIFLQGTEGGRAFSFVIDEATGFVTVAVARDGFTVSVFGACTPKPE